MNLKDRLFGSSEAKTKEMNMVESISVSNFMDTKKLMISTIAVMTILTMFTVPAFAENRTRDNTALEETVNAEYEKKLKATEEAASSIQEAAVSSESTDSSSNSTLNEKTSTIAEGVSSTEANTGETDDAALSIPDAESVAAEALASVTEKDSLGDKVAQYASQFIGNPYRYGGCSLTSGTDCSGFVMSVYANFGISLPHSSSAMRSVGVAVGSLYEAQPGDIICYSGHVGIYLGEGRLLSALGSRYGITINSATYKRILAIRRLV
ncbi:C40 family peptidase [Oribacterium sp. FC2011]|uniref:C40 family peptidase n=1 Tax=Oribacterium sp. FC2011 TaxID=1408311 RepID=UPI000A882130|nr:C40 family peptidase [Oribacterium sp. FC2011]